MGRPRPMHHLPNFIFGSAVVQVAEMHKCMNLVIPYLSLDAEPVLHCIHLDPDEYP